jgi:hypothetical protein
VNIDNLPRSLYPLDPHHDSLTEAVLSAIECDQWWDVDGFSNVSWQRVEDYDRDRQTTKIRVSDGYVVGLAPSRIPSIFDGETEFGVAQEMNRRYVRAHEKAVSYPGPTWLWPNDTNPFASLH